MNFSKFVVRTFECQRLAAFTTFFVVHIGVGVVVSINPPIYSSLFQPLICVVVLVASSHFFLRAPSSDSLLLKRVNHITVFFTKRFVCEFCCMMVLLKTQNFGSSVELKLCPCSQLPSQVIINGWCCTFCVFFVTFNIIAETCFWAK